MKSLFLLGAACAGLASLSATADETEPQPLVYAGETGVAQGKRIVFIASDPEYRSEEALPALARILAKRYGATCTVLFGLDPKTGLIKPGTSNIPGTVALKTADLLFIFTRFQNLPAGQMQPIVDYLERGGPVIGLRTATHAFSIGDKTSPFAKYTHNNPGPEYQGGFGRQILGETWVGHYGPNHKSSTRLEIVPAHASHPILRGVKDAWAEIGAYNAHPIEGSEILLDAIPLEGMEQTSPVDATKQPMPGAWVREYTSGSGRKGRVFASTYGASDDLLNEGLRRAIVNACLWTMGLENAIKPGNDIAFVGPYQPTWHNAKQHAKPVKPQELAGWETPIPILETK